MHTLEDIRNGVAKLVGTSGMCPDDPRVLTAINEARRILYDLGDWEPFVDPLCIYPHEGTITLPARYKYAKSAYICKQRIVVENDWFNQIGNWDQCCGPCLGNLVRVPGQFVTFRDWPTCSVPNLGPCCAPDGFWLNPMLETNADREILLTFKGPSSTREILSLTRWVTSQAFEYSGPAPHEQKFLGLTHLIKPKTVGRVRLYGYDGANRILLALYDPDDVNPQFTRYRVPGHIRGPVLVKAKKKYIPLSDDPTEIVEVSEDVLIHVLQAITDREGRNTTGYSMNIQAAVGLLNKQGAGPESTSTVPIRFSRAYKVTGLVEY